MFPFAEASWLDAGPSLQVSERVYEYQVEMPKAQWLAMVRARFWSTFSHFSDDELAAGVRELEERFQVGEYSLGRVVERNCQTSLFHRGPIPRRVHPSCQRER